VSWFADVYEIVDIVKNSGRKNHFEITVLNKGGKGQPFTISNIPSWLKLSRSSGLSIQIVKLLSWQQLIDCGILRICTN
jgi:hypothetical protein